MKHQHLLVVIVILFIGSVQASSLQYAIDKLPKNMQTVAKGVITLAPDRYTRGVEQWMSMIGLEAHGGENIGLVNHFNNLLNTSSCFQSLTAEYYGKIFEESSREAIETINKGKLPEMESAKINETILNVGRQPGVFWKMALEFAGGDPNLAMALIGTCGHDDMSQIREGITIKVVDSRKRALKLVEDFMKSPVYQQKMDLIYADAKKKYPKVDFTRAQLISSLTSKFSTSFCPDRSSGFFHAKALGTEADISKNLKDKIVRLQAPTAGAKVINSKSYHVIAGAVSGCTLVQHGLPGFVSKELVALSVNGYRAGTLCNSNLSEGWGALPSRNIDELIAAALKFRRDDKHECFKSERDESSTSVMYELKSELKKCQIGYFLPPGLWFDEDLEPSALRKKLERKIAEADAAELFRLSPSFSKSNRCAGMQFTKEVWKFLEQNGSEGSKNPCPTVWSKERCTNARKVMATYAVDFEWSEAQHLAGLEFAQKNCNQTKDGWSVEVASCKALKAQKEAGSKLPKEQQGVN